MYDPKRFPLTPQQLNQPEVRPWLKVVSTVMLALVGAMYAFTGLKLFSAKSLSITACTDTKASSLLLCKTGNLILGWIPAQYRGSYEGVLHLVAAAALMFAAFLLIRSSRK